MTDGLIEAKVAALLSAQDLAINKGSDDGVHVGMRFAILNEKGADIKDPDTGNPLGSVELAKTLVKIVSVEPKLSVGRTFRTVTGTSFARMAGLIGGVDKVETLRSDASRLQDELHEADSYIKIGDVAKQYKGEEYGGLVYEFH